MKRFFRPFFILAVTCALIAPAHAASPTLHVAVFGDSLTSGYELQPEESYPAKLQRKFQEMGYTNVDVINVSVAGRTTADAADQMQELLLKNPDIVVVELGANDVQLGINSGLISSNLAKILDTLASQRIYVVLLGVKSPSNLGYGYSQQIDAMFSGLAQKYRVSFYPSVLQGVAGHQELTLADGLHPNAKGVDVMVEGTYRFVDTGLRWKWNTIQYQEYQKQYQNNLLNPVPTKQ